MLSLATNHPKQGDIARSTRRCAAWGRRGLGTWVEAAAEAATLQTGATAAPRAASASPPPAPAAPRRGGDAAGELRRLFDEFVERGRELIGERGRGARRSTEPTVITGAALGLPGAERLFDDGNIARLLHGEQGIDVIPGAFATRSSTSTPRLVKGEDGGARFETIDRLDDVIKLAARAGTFDLHEEFGVDDDRIQALGRATQLAIAAGIDALRDAGIPLVLRYKTTTKGTQLPDRWSLPDELRDDTGVIFASAFPGLEEMADEVARYTVDHMRRERLDALESLRERMLDHDGTDAVVLAEVERRIHDVRRQLEDEAYTFDRRFLFRVLDGTLPVRRADRRTRPQHAGERRVREHDAGRRAGRGLDPRGRCRRGDRGRRRRDLGHHARLARRGLPGLRAAATDEVVEDAALPFDQRRHGMILGMGAAGSSSRAPRRRASAG